MFEINAKRLKKNTRIISYANELRKYFSAYIMPTMKLKVGLD